MISTKTDVRLSPGPQSIDLTTWCEFWLNTGPKSMYSTICIRHPCRGWSKPENHATKILRLRRLIWRRTVRGWKVKSALGFCGTFDCFEGRMNKIEIGHEVIIRCSLSSWPLLPYINTAGINQITFYQKLFHKWKVLLWCYRRFDPQFYQYLLKSDDPNPVQSEDHLRFIGYCVFMPTGSRISALLLATSD